MKKEQGNIWECKTRFTFYLNPKDEKKLLNYANIKITSKLAEVPIQ